MLTHQLVRGEPSSILLSAIERRAAGGYGDASEQFSDEPPLRCEVWPGGDLPVVAAPPCAWEADGSGRGVAVTFPEATTAALPVGWYKARVVTDDEARDGVAAFMLTVLPGPGTGELRPAYHTYEDLLAEYPFVRRFVDKTVDRSGFSRVSSEARDWLDDALAGEAPEHCRSLYADALAADRLIVDTPAGRRLAKATVHKALSMILRRAEGVANAPGDVVERQQYYEALADSTLAGATAAFAESTGLAPLRMGGFRVARLVR